MAVMQMERIHLCAMKRDRKKILELLQRRGSVEVSDLPVEDEIFKKTDTSRTQELFLKNAQTAQSAVEILDRHSPPEGGGFAFLKGRTPITVEQNDGFHKKREAILRTAQRIVALDREIAEAKGEISKIEARLEALTPWMNLPVPQTYKGTKKTRVLIGSLEGEQSLESILTRLAEEQPELGPVHLEIVFTSPDITAFYLIALKKDADKAEDGLRNMGFARPTSSSSKMPKKKKELLMQEHLKAEKVIEDSEKEIQSLATSRDEIHMLEDHMKARAEKYDVIERLTQTRHVFVLDGYVPAVNATGLSEELTRKFDCAAQLTPLEPDEEGPVLLKNSWFSEPTESVLESYSLPGKGEMDPVNIMSIFYYIMFGLMFSDAGYGLVLAGACGFILLKFKNMDANWSKNIRLFFWCGISTVFWGIIFSSYFGDVVNVVSRVFIGKEVGIPPVWFAPLENPMLLLVFCRGIGIVHLTTGYVMKGITCFQNKQYADIVYDAVFPIALIYPLVVILMGNKMFSDMAGFQLSLSPMVTTICLAISGFCMAGILFTGGRESKNWGKRLLKGAYALYNALAGWLSDILSYSRLLALGLATGVIGSVINQLGTMGGSGIIGFIMFVLVFALGHSMNFGINVLGAYVHSNRLEFVEFFGKFYEGGGRKFLPFGMHTKYYKIEEETQNV